MNEEAFYTVEYSAIKILTNLLQKIHWFGGKKCRYLSKTIKIGSTIKDMIKHKKGLQKLVKDKNLLPHVWHWPKSNLPRLFSIKKHWIVIVNL